MSGALDLAAKLLLHTDPVALARLVLGPGVVTVRVDDSELASRPIRTDKLLRVVLRGQREPVWLHVEIQATWRPEVPRRTFEYWSAAHRRLDRVVSVVLCLRPAPRRGRVRSEYVVRVRGRVAVAFDFDVIRAWTLRTRKVLQHPGLIPLLPFVDGASEELVQRGLRLLDRVRSTRRRADLQAALAVFAGVVFPEQRWLAMIPGELRMRSSVLDELERLGRLHGQQDLVAKQLRARLGAQRAAKYVRRLRRCEDLQAFGTISTRIARGVDDESLLALLERRLPPARGPVKPMTSEKQRRSGR